LDRYEKLSLLDGLQVKTFKKGEVIVREGDFGDHFFIVEDGHVECLNKAKRPDGYIVEFVIRKLTSGDHFGELALINNEKRTLTVRCGSPEVKLLSLDRATFDRILGQITNFLNRDYSDLMMPSRIMSTDHKSFGSQTKTTPSFMRRSSINISMGQLQQLQAAMKNQGFATSESSINGDPSKMSHLGLSEFDNYSHDNEAV